jgi:hypothetical protein
MVLLVRKKVGMWEEAKFLLRPGPLLLEADWAERLGVGLVQQSPLACCCETRSGTEMPLVSGTARNSYRW